MGERESAVENMGVEAAFWRGKRVLLTGHTGFKGAWLSLWLQQMGAEVTGLALAPDTQPNLFEVAKVAEGMTSIVGDIRDRALVLQVMQQAKPEIVIHMAAQALVRPSYQFPVETYETNVMGTVHVLDAVRQTPGVKAVVSVTSDKCYENREWQRGYTEDDAMGGHDPYSNSKGCAELVTASYRNSFLAEQGVALASGRAGNVIGGGDWAVDRLIPDMLRAISAGQPVKIRSPHAIRPWQHVLEPLSGYLELAQKLYTDGAAFAEGWNFGPAESDAKPVEWVIEKLTQLWGEGASWVLDNNPQPHEATYLKLDCTKAKERMGWQARWPLETTLARIVRWHKAFDAKADMRGETLADITDYTRAA